MTLLKSAGACVGRVRAFNDTAAKYVYQIRRHALWRYDKRGRFAYVFAYGGAQIIAT
jgi:hypothetical protein